MNQKTIADRLGISRATVSRCFTNHAGINPATRARVFEMAAELGYVHRESRSPAVKRAHKKGSFHVLICSETEEYFRDDYDSPGEQIMVGVSEYAQAHDIRVDVNFIPPGATGLSDPAFREIKSLRSRRNRGILLIYPFPDPLIRELAHRYPLVSLVDQLEHEKVDCVDVDHGAGISMLIDHLCAQGHRRIGFYTRDYAIAASWSFRRYSGFVEKMARERLDIDLRDTVGIFPRDFATVDEGVAEVIKRTRDGVTAWVCAADHQAYDLIEALTKSGLRVPTDVSVTGYDGIFHQPSRPSLATIKIPFSAIGTTGAERLAGRIRKRSGDSQNVSISGKLIEGDSVAPPGT